MYVTKVRVVNQSDILCVLVDLISSLSSRVGQPVALVKPAYK